MDDLIDCAAGLISVLDDVRPLDPATYNASYEIWHAIAAIPPSDRPRLIDELEPGALRSLWRYSLSRYVLDPERCAEIFSGYSVWDDFPEEPGQVSGHCSRSPMAVVLCVLAPGDLCTGSPTGGQHIANHTMTTAACTTVCICAAATWLLGQHAHTRILQCCSICGLLQP